MTERAPLTDELVLAWRQHWPYFKVALAIFAIGVLIGIVLVGRVDLFAAMGFEDLDDIFPDELSATVIFVNNSIVFVLAILGVLTFGLLTLMILVFNGLLVGYVVTPAAAEIGIDFVLVAIVPHGILELPAFFVAAAVAFRLIHRFYLRVRRREDRVLEGGDLRRMGLLLGAAWLVLALAALIEMYVTFWLIEALFPELAAA